MRHILEGNDASILAMITSLACEDCLKFGHEARPGMGERPTSNRPPCGQPRDLRTPPTLGFAHPRDLPRPTPRSPADGLDPPRRNAHQPLRLVRDAVPGHL